MQLNGAMKVVYQAGEWIIRLVYANLLWMLFTLLGLGIFGFMPATVSLFALLRKWIIGNEVESAFTIFWTNYRKEFLKANLFGVMFLVIGLIIRLDILFFQDSSNIVFQILFVLMICLSLLYFITIVNFFPVYVHFDLSILNYVKYAFLIGLSQLSSTLMMIFGSIIIFCLYWYVSGLIPLLCVSLFCLNIMWFGYRAFKKIELEQQK
ncbi:YesL family protein [Metabacillus niabensis]|uniref:Membrane protein YesL n=1 Tax=Metabacillus niabensis TaxID=324854 RepID=A0ABT9Z1L2_9BACI|nr:YesL family protein [Metabacillus niabensis]MDQ0226120.1 putative membrane protein YesL [Metabacillus niabensis]